MAPFSQAWLERYRDLLDADAEMRVIGGHFTLWMAVTFGEDRCVVCFEQGRLVRWVLSPRIDVPSSFGFRSSREIWLKYLGRSPEPLYHDVFAMLMRVPGFVLEGDTLVAMQNARALHRAMKIMQSVGAGPRP